MAESLYIPDLKDLTADHQSKCPSLAPGSAGTPYPVDIVLYIFRHIVVDHSLDIIYVESSCGYVGGDKDLRSSVPEARHHMIPLLLRQIPVKRIRKVPPSDQGLGQLIRHPLGIGKDKRPFRIVIVKKPRDRVCLHTLRNLIEILLHKRDGQFLCRDLHKDRVTLLIIFGDLQYGAGHRG